MSIFIDEITIDVKDCEYYNINGNDIARGSIIDKAKLYDVKKYLNYKEYFLDKEAFFFKSHIIKLFMDL